MSGSWNRHLLSREQGVEVENMNILSESHDGTTKKPTSVTSWLALTTAFDEQTSSIGVYCAPWISLFPLAGQ